MSRFSSSSAAERTIVVAVEPVGDVHQVGGVVLEQLPEDASLVRPPSGGRRWRPAARRSAARRGARWSRRSPGRGTCLRRCRSGDRAATGSSRRPRRSAAWGGEPTSIRKSDGKPSTESARVPALEPRKRPSASPIRWEDRARARARARARRRAKRAPPRAPRGPRPACSCSCSCSCARRASAVGRLQRPLAPRADCKRSHRARASRCAPRRVRPLFCPPLREGVVPCRSRLRGDPPGRHSCRLPRRHGCSGAAAWARSGPRDERHRTGPAPRSPSRSCSPARR